MVAIGVPDDLATDLGPQRWKARAGRHGADVCQPDRMGYIVDAKEDSEGPATDPVRGSASKAA
ncbi:hypothetical protein [Streptomyces sp. NPDC058726]|uniref:hypothetical protein n=1 Tax=Streptomyces sp. NPDC058726 TaxID=3346611 RepID=UPI0036AD0C90